MSAGEDRPQPIDVTDELLHGYADGHLDGTHAAAVEAFLATHPDKAAEVALWQRQNAGLKALFGPVGREPVPPRLDLRRLAALQSRRRWDWTKIAAAAVVTLGVGVGTGWAMRTVTWQEEPAFERLIDGALVAHGLYVKESRHAVEVGANDQEHLVTWLSNRLGRQIGTPDLTAQGFTLVGGRLLPPLAETGTGPAAQLMYQNATANRITVYITAAGAWRDRAFDAETRKGLEAYYWANDQITCTVVGDLPVADMKSVANGVFQQLTWRPDPPGRT